jgi:predicted regulator of Ras-like GTPase activity (Roadblock/LC7/MglB family)
MSAGNRIDSSFASILQPYLELKGVKAAALISSEGLPVAETGTGGYDFKALGAYAAAILANASDLAGELGGDGIRAASINLYSLGLVLLPLNSELLLVLAGDSDILGLAAGDAILP